MPLKTSLRIAFILAVAVMGTAASRTEAQEGGDDFSGWYVGGNTGVSFGGFDADGYTAEIRNASDILVNGRGIIIVPGFTTSVAASSSGDLPDFHSTPCHNFGTVAPVCQDEAQTADSRAQRLAAFLGGLHFGFNKRSRDFLVGGEVELGGSTFTGTSQVIELQPSTALTGAGQSLVTPPMTTFTRKASGLWSSTVNVRVGGIWMNTLLYGVGGPILADMTLKSRDTFFQTLSDGSSPCPCSGPGQTGVGNAAATVGSPTITAVNESSDNALLFGWDAGAGIEHRIWNRWNLAAEYRHSQLTADFPGTKGQTSIPDGSGGINVGGAGGITSPSTQMHFKEDRVTARINYHFQ